MSSLAWYFYRLQKMDLQEVLWRIQSKLDSKRHARKVANNWRPVPQLALNKQLTSHYFDDEQHLKGFKALWQESLITSCAPLLHGQFEYFGRLNALNSEYLWHFDVHSQVVAPLKPIQQIDYRESKVSGDCKEVWEANRHTFFPKLAAAYRVTRDPEYYEQLIMLWQSWCDKNPYGYGMNWRSPLELGIRVINWSLSKYLLGHAKASEVSQFDEQVYAHCYELSRSFSKGSSANNHLIGEAAGLFIAAIQYPQFKESSEWRDKALAVLQTAFTEQIDENGSGTEKAFGYQYFVWQFYALVVFFSRLANITLPNELLKSFERYTDFIVTLCAHTDSPPYFGDNDDGFVFDLGDPRDNLDMIVGVTSHLLNKKLTVSRPVTLTQTAFWFGATSPADVTVKAMNESQYLKGAELVMLQNPATPLPAKVVMDVGRLGHGALAAHGHDDALSVLMYIHGMPVLVDSGTFDYFTYPHWRQYFRSRFAHNTCALNDAPHCISQGPFLWQKGDTTKLLEHAFLEKSHHAMGANYAQGSHNASLQWQRQITLSQETCNFDIEDRALNPEQGLNKMVQYFHFSPLCHDFILSENELTFKLGDTIHVTCQFASHAKATIHHGEEGQKPLGWFSDTYHHKVPIHSLKLSYQDNLTSPQRVGFSWHAIA